MDRRHTGWVRPALVLGVLGVVAAALIISPASAHFEPRHERKHVKKIARRIARRLATTIVQTRVGPTLFIEETELQRFGPIEANVGATEATVATFGEFTVSLLCQGTAALPQTRIQIRTSADNAILASPEDSDADLDTADMDVDILDDTALVANQQEMNVADGAFVVGNAAGTQFFDGEVQGAMNYSGSDCWASGSVLVIASP
jgi:hypothetical protein